ncbi:HK97 gp10 family phage protein [Brevibacillus centrosporus]|uniref:HK97 gp10 family phage protein n=1 Tax=Brevibacillus centrosporus TaxID=54910 RepID=UPI002E1ACE77|nr:HK97 gp10 family phage protein [Brevibacillus centrosporus]
MDFREFHEKMKKLNKSVPDALERIVYQLGEALLNTITDEIIKQNLIDTGAAGLLGSFSQGDPNNVWEFDSDRNTITLEVGSNLSYAPLVNDGYEIKKAHFVPGYVSRTEEGPRFRYDPDAKSGVMMKPRVFIGRQYFDIALQDFQGGMKRMIEELLDKELERKVK